MNAIRQPEHARDRVLELAEYFEDRSPLEVLEWAVECFGPKMTFACSFGLEDVALLDLITRVEKAPDVFYLDTGVLFPETLDTRNRLSRRYGLTFRQLLPALNVQEQSKVFGEKLWEREPSQCCWLRKIEPLRRALRGYDAWITGVRRDQSPTRANTQLVEWDDTFQLVKINPLAAWTAEQVRAHVDAHDVPFNPLHDQGYPSIGCLPCTSQVKPGEDPRAGRWRGSQMTECGLHPAQGGSA